MVYHKDEKDVANFLYCAGSLEERYFSLYRNLSEKVRNPMVKSSLLYIAYDSLKHSIILRGIGESIFKAKPKDSDCQKKMRQIWEKVLAFSREVSGKQGIGDEELPTLMRRLAGLENSISEEYFILVQLRTLDFMTKEISEIYKVDLQKLKGILELVMKDEENHQEILMRIADSFTEEVVRDNTPIVRYQNPNAW